MYIRTVVPSISSLDVCATFEDTLCSPSRSSEPREYDDDQEFLMNSDVVWAHAHCMWNLSMSSDKSYSIDIERFTYPALKDDMSITITKSNGTTLELTNLELSDS